MTHPFWSRVVNVAENDHKSVEGAVIFSHGERQWSDAMSVKEWGFLRPLHLHRLSTIVNRSI